ncbi:MAG: L,D-transpeptidase [Terrimicrobiaceae bacterium]
MPDPNESSSAPLSLKVSIQGQRLDLLQGDSLLASYPVSSSAYGLGFEEGSLKTPTGRFEVAAKIGDGAPLGAVFCARQPTGEISAGGGDDDQILTRILWLNGLDPENQNTQSRFIYIHGTNREDLIGSPASHGCIRMKNLDIIELFERIPEGTTVEIG